MGNITKIKKVTMKTIPEGMRPYERLEKFGAEALSDAELLAVLIKSGTKEKSALVIAEELILNYGSLADLGRAEINDLRQQKGIGRVKSIEIFAAAELGKRIAVGKRKTPVKITDIEQLKMILLLELKALRQEVFAVLLFDKKWQYIKSVKVSAGTVEQALVHPREVFYHAVKNMASAIVLAHNHPSGDCNPGKTDLETTKRIVKAGMLMGIEVTDHIIVGNGECYSMYCEGDMDRIKKSLSEE